MGGGRNAYKKPTRGWNPVRLVEVLESCLAQKHFLDFVFKITSITIKS